MTTKANPNAHHQFNHLRTSYHLNSIVSSHSLTSERTIPSYETAGSEILSIIWRLQSTIAKYTLVHYMMEKHDSLITAGQASERFQMAEKLALECQESTELFRSRETEHHRRDVNCAVSELNCEILLADEWNLLVRPSAPQSSHRTATSPALL